MTAHDGNGTNWDITEPVTATGRVTDGAKEMRDLRKGTALRLAVEHVDFQDAVTLAGDSESISDPAETAMHLPGSARIIVGANAPTTLTTGGKDLGGDSLTHLISANTAEAEGRMWADNNHAYALQVYEDGTGWRPCGVYDNSIYDGAKNVIYVNGDYSGGTNAPIKIVMTGAVSGSRGIDIDIDGTHSSTYGIYVDLDASSTGDAFYASITSGATGHGMYINNASADADGIYVNNSTTGVGVNVLNNSTGDGIKAQNGSTGSGIDIQNTSTGVGMKITATNNGPHLNLTTNATVASPAEGDIWREGDVLHIYIGGTEYTIDMTAV